MRTLQRVWRRIRSDGRLPPESRRLAVDALSTATRSALARPVSQLTPVVGRGLGPVADVRRGGWRRWSTAGPLTASVHELQHEVATAVVEALEAAGVAPFAVSGRSEGVVLGITVDQRDAALQALARLEPRGTWYVTGERGSRRRTVLASARWRPGVVRRAATWSVFRLWDAADGVLVGREAAVEIGLWAPGPRDRLERVGVRGLTRFPAASAPTVEEVDGRSYPSRAAFPAGRSLERQTLDVDIVFTWVDGDDPAWRAERARWSGDAAQTVTDAVAESRFRSRDELRYALRSVAEFAGWARRIFVVTSGQRPEWLVEDDRLRVVPHAEIFPADWLPTFNSHSIESRLHHVPGLAEHFVYFNDDMFLGRPVTRSLFFTPNGIPLHFLGAGRFDVADTGGALGVDAAARNGRRLIEEAFGRVPEHKLLHAPYAHRRAILLELEQRWPDEMARTGRSRFRSVDDLSVASSFAQLAGYCMGMALPGAIAAKYVNIENPNVAQHLRQIDTRHFDAFCLNATEQALADESRVDRLVADFLDGYFPRPSPWERT